MRFEKKEGYSTFKNILYRLSIVLHILYQNNGFVILHSYFCQPPYINLLLFIKHPPLQKKKPKQNNNNNKKPTQLDFILYNMK